MGNQVRGSSSGNVVVAVGSNGTDEMGAKEYGSMFSRGDIMS